MNETLWTVRDVARFLGLPVATIYAWRYHGTGPPAFRVGRHLRYRPSEVESWLEEKRVRSCPVGVEDGNWRSVQAKRTKEDG
jgi:excisionase family DNA binding protein